MVDIIVFMHKFNVYVRNVRTEESAWDEDDMFLEHDYYNSIPGKEPPLGGIVDSRLKTPAALLGHIHSLSQSKAAQVLTLAFQSQAPVPCTASYLLRFTLFLMAKPVVEGLLYLLQLQRKFQTVQGSS